MSVDPGTAPIRPAYIRDSDGNYYRIGGGGKNDHGELDGLEDNDHPQYLRQVVQAAPPAGDINTRWIDSDNGLEYRWDTGSSTWVQIGTGVTVHTQLTGLSADDHGHYAPIQVINTGDTPSTTYQRNGSLVVRRNVETGTGLGFLPLQGGTMTGALSLYGDPSLATHAATKAYADLGGYTQVARARSVGDGWYRIAVHGPMVSGSGSGGTRAASTFRVYTSDGSRHDYTEFTVTHSFGTSTLNVTEMNRFSTIVLSQVRVIDGGTYDGCAVEINLTNLQATTDVWYEMQSSRWPDGFTPVNWAAGSLPAGMAVTGLATLAQMNVWYTPTLLNSWTGAANEVFRYRKTAGGIVHVGGIVRNGSSITAPIYTFPVGYRPTYDMYFGLVMNAIVMAYGRVLTTGSILIEAGAAGASASWAMINITFPADL